MPEHAGQIETRKPTEEHAMHMEAKLVRAGLDSTAYFKDFRMKLNLAPAQPEPTGTTNLTLTFTTHEGEPIDDLEITHTKKLHLIVISEDLEEYRHVHPERVGPGVYTLKHTFGKATRYGFWAEISRSDQGFTAEFTRDTTGAVIGAKPKTDLLREKVLQGYRVVFNPEPKKSSIGEKTTLRFRVADATNGEPTKLGEYLGASGHLIVVGADHPDFRHLHAIEIGNNMDMGSNKMESGALHFGTTFMDPGVYKMWVEFQPKSSPSSLAVPFMLVVK